MCAVYVFAAIVHQSAIVASRDLTKMAIDACDIGIVLCSSQGAVESQCSTIKIRKALVVIAHSYGYSCSDNVLDSPTKTFRVCALIAAMRTSPRET